MTAVEESVGSILNSKSRKGWGCSKNLSENNPVPAKRLFLPLVQKPVYWLTRLGSFELIYTLT
jgi:hypothetical protein